MNEYEINFVKELDGFTLDHEFSVIINQPNLFLEKFKQYLDVIKNSEQNVDTIKLCHNHEVYNLTAFKKISQETIKYIETLLNKYNIQSLFFEDNNLYNSVKFTDIIKHKSYPFFLGMTHPYAFTISPRTFTKKFICLNSREKAHRSQILKFLYDSKISEDSVLSHEFNIDGKNPKTIDLNEYEEIKNTVYYTSYYKPTLSHYKTFCNIVTETFFYEKNITFITEKTEKCFSAGQPFIIVSTYKFLDNLKKLGFKTFDKWWDESYDDEFNDEKRLEKIKNVITYINSLSLDELNKIYEEMIPILVHNRAVNKKWYLKNIQLQHQKM